MAMNKHLEVIVEEDKWLDCLENVAEYSQKVFEKTLDYLTEIVKEVSPTLSIHDFRVVKGPTHTNLIFDMLVPFDFTMSDVDLADTVQNKIWKYNPVYFAVIEIDKDYTKNK